MSSVLRWNEVSVSSWEQLLEELQPMLGVYSVPPAYLFRGQADASWDLEPSLLRRIRGIRDRLFAQSIEQHLEKEFMVQAFLLPDFRDFCAALSAAPRHECWAFMQHHNCPTRLLDWTASPFIATYFAVEQLPASNGAVFVVAPASLSQDIDTGESIDCLIPDEAFFDATGPDRLCFSWPQLRSSRSAAQQGNFSACTNILARHDDAILSACLASAKRQPNYVFSKKIVITSHLKLEVLGRLRVMNIAPHALFPTVDGLGKSVADLASLLRAAASNI
jgi:hypothetical protein